MSIVSENIKYLRKLNGFTQEQFAKRIGIKRSTLGAYEEARAHPNIIYLDNMSQIFGVPVNEILNENIRGKKLNIHQTSIYKLNSSTNTSTANSTASNPPAISKSVTEVKEPVLEKEKKSESPIEESPKPTFIIDQSILKSPDEVKSLKVQDKVLQAIQGKSGYKMFNSVPECPNTLLVGYEEEDLYNIKDKTYYYFVTRNHGKRYSRVYNELKDRNTLLLVPADRKENMLELGADEILEAWEIVAYISESPSSVSEENNRVKSLVTELGKIVNG